MTRRKRYVRSRQNENNDRKRKRLLVAFLMLLLTGVAFTTATYAWFTSNNAIDTQDIDLKVTAATGISISANALDFKKTIHMSEVIAFAKTGCVTGGTTACPSTLQYPEKLNPVSTVGMSGKNATFYKASVSPTQHATAKYIAQFENVAAESYGFINVCSGTSGDDKDCLRTSGDYLAFDFWIKSGSDYDLDIDSSHTSAKVLSGTDTKNLESGLRMMFAIKGYHADVTDQSTIANWDVAPTSTQWKIYNPYPYMHHKDSLKDTMPSTKSGGEFNDGDEANFGYYAVKSIPDSESSVTKYNADAVVDPDGTYIPFTYNYLKDGGITSYGSFFQEIKAGPGGYANYAQAKSNSDLSTGNVVLHVGPGITKVRCYIWLEGQDIDTVDAISFSNGIKLSFGFITMTD